MGVIAGRRGIVQRGNIGRMREMEREERRGIGPASGITSCWYVGRSAERTKLCECHYPVLCVFEVFGACCTIIVHATSGDVVVLCGARGEVGGMEDTDGI